VHGHAQAGGAPWFDFDTPVGGYKQGGLGREFGETGLEEHGDQAISKLVSSE
jgi:hypothetical protein